MSYPFEKVSEEEYVFISKGPRGEIKKVVIFKYYYRKIYNVVLESEINGIRMNDLERTNNGDVFKVLNTLVKIIKEELKLHPRRVILICGSDQQRERIYQRTALLYASGITIFGQAINSNGWQLLDKNNDYTAILIFNENPII